MGRILIAEDELHINELIKKNLTLVGHSCAQAFDGKEALEMLAEGQYDLMVLDVMMPHFSGFEVLKKTSGTPTIFVTAKNALADRLQGLSLGADDYIVKPFEILELVARVNAVLRRTKKTGKEFTVDNIRVDFESRRVFKDGTEVTLKPKEYELLEALIVNRNLALSRSKLLDLVWGYDFEGDSRTVDVHIQKLRSKLSLEDRIKTVQKVGYRLEV